MPGEHTTPPNGGRNESTRSYYLIEFVHRNGTYTGVGPGEREWSISSSLTGWRLEFRDPGDEVATYAGTHGSLAAAQREANWLDSRSDPNSLPAQRRRRPEGS
jgi:hypothetical protein